jgi:hypothetical protein
MAGIRRDKPVASRHRLRLGRKLRYAGIGYTRDTMEIGDADDHGLSTAYDVVIPSIVEGLKALTMDVCSGVEFNPPGGLQTLTQLTITGNDCLCMFAAANPVLTTLETLDLACCPELAKHTLQEFKEALRKCTNLVRLCLIIGGPRPQDDSKTSGNVWVPSQ